VAALLIASGVAVAVQEPRTLMAPTVAAVAPTLPPDLPRLAATYDAPATQTGVDESAAPAGPQRIPRIVDGDEEVPARALEAYQRAAAVIGQADPSCHMAWPLLAAIGRVESDHGRTGGSQLAPDGKARPAILGPRLDGRRGTARVIDTDRGTLDGDALVDRALGPMQFIPATWAAVAVDADGDDQRDPQDIDDAALAAAVFLCAGHDDLATETGQRTAVLRYDHSSSYLQVVLAIMTRYANSHGTGALLLGAMGPVTSLGVEPGPVVVDTSSDETRDQLDSSWNDVHEPSWVTVRPPPPPPPPPPPGAPPPPTPIQAGPTSAATGSVPPSDLPTPEDPSSSTPSPGNTPSPSEEASPAATPSPVPSATEPSDATPAAHVGPPPEAPADLAPEEQKVVTACNPGPAILTDEDVLTCLAEGFQLLEDDPRLPGILAELAAPPLDGP
jgi:hypothetical protein